MDVLFTASYLTEVIKGIRVPFYSSSLKGKYRQNGSQAQSNLRKCPGNHQEQFCEQACTVRTAAPHTCEFAGVCTTLIFFNLKG